MRDYTDLLHLVILSNLETINTSLISDNISQRERLIKLNNNARMQMEALKNNKNIKDLDDVLHTDLKGAVGGVHLLPFFPSTGDRGFAPTDYSMVDPQFGDWSDVEKLGEEYYLMFDFMIEEDG